MPTEQGNHTPKQPREGFWPYGDQLDRIEAVQKQIRNLDVSIIQQNERIEAKLNRVLGLELTEQRKLKDIMGAVQLEQDDLDAVGDSLENLVSIVQQIDTSQLPDADKTKLSQGLTDLTTAINDKLSPSTPVTPPADGDV